MITAASPLILIGNDFVASAQRDQVVDFLAQQKVYHFTQHPDWARAHDPQDFVGVGTVCDGLLVAWTLVRRRRLPFVRLSKYFGARGPVAQDLNAIPQHVADLARVLSADGLYLALHPYAFGELGRQLSALLRGVGFEQRAADEMYYSATLAIDLTQPLQNIRAGFRRSIKTQINKSARLGVTVTELTSSSDHQQFAQNYALAMRKKGIRTPANLCTLLNIFASSPHGLALQGHWQGEAVAGIGLVACGSNLVYEWGYTSPSPEHRALPLQHALHWQAIQLAKELGFVSYDLGGFWAEAGSGDPINRFKLGFTNEQQTSAEALTLYWRPRLARLITRNN